MNTDRVDVEQSRQMGKRVHARNKSCYFNAWKALEFFKRARYVEGWCASPPGLVARHAWVELRNGTIVDPTPIYYKEPEGRKYFAGRRYTRSKVIRLMMKTGWVFPLDSDFRLECIPLDLIDVYNSACDSVGPALCKTSRARNHA